MHIQTYTTLSLEFCGQNPAPPPSIAFIFHFFVFSFTSVRDVPIMVLEAQCDQMLACLQALVKVRSGRSHLGREWTLLLGKSMKNK